MKPHFLIFTAGVVFLLGPMMTEVPATAGPEVKQGFSLCLTKDKTVYASGEAIQMSLTALNQTPNEVILRFKDAQRFDFLIEQEGKEIWRWSKGQVFAQVLGEERWRPKESITYSAKFDGKLQPGKYRFTGIIVADLSPLAASCNIVIR